MEKRSNDVTKTKFVKLWDRLAYPDKTSLKIEPVCDVTFPF